MVAWLHVIFDTLGNRVVFAGGLSFSLRSPSSPRKGFFVRRPLRKGTIVPLTIPDAVLESTRMNRIDFQSLLASRDISLRYDTEELQEDVETLTRLGRI